MKSRWAELSLRDKQIVAYGTLALIVFLLYEITLAPLQSSVETMRLRIVRDKSLLTWMQDADKRIQAADGQATQIASPITGSLLSFLQNAVTQAELDKAVVSLQQSENDSVQIRFHQINFDQLAKWLQGLTAQSVTIKQLSITPVKNMLGSVDADVILQH